MIADKIPTCSSCGSGVVKPNVVFFGEDLPARYRELQESDFKECDLLVVMGTSLKVQPFCSLVQRVRQTTPRLLVITDDNFSLKYIGYWQWLSTQHPQIKLPEEKSIYSKVSTLWCALFSVLPAQ